MMWLRYVASTRFSGQCVMVYRGFIVGMQIDCAGRMIGLAVHVIQIRVTEAIIGTNDVRFRQHRWRRLLLLVNVRCMRCRLAADVVRLQDTIVGRIEEILFDGRMVR